MIYISNKFLNYGLKIIAVPNHAVMDLPLKFR